MKKYLIALAYYLHYLLFILGAIAGMAFLPILEYNLGHIAWYWSLVSILPALVMGFIGLGLTVLLLAPSFLLLQKHIDPDLAIE